MCVRASVCVRDGIVLVYIGVCVQCHRVCLGFCVCVCVCVCVFGSRAINPDTYVCCTVLLHIY